MASKNNENSKAENDAKYKNICPLISFIEMNKLIKKFL